MKKMILLIAAGAASLMFLAIQESKLPAKTSNLRLTQIAGLELFELKGCTACHTLAGKAEVTRTPVANNRDDVWFSDHVGSESELVLGQAKKKRKKKKLLKKEVAALNDFLFESDSAAKKQIFGLAANLRNGAYLAYQNNCIGCHRIAGGGKETAPDLTFAADKKSDRSWHIKNLKNPQQFSAESVMPAFDEKLSDEQLGQIADYLLTLRK